MVITQQMQGAVQYQVQPVIVRVFSLLGGFAQDRGPSGADYRFGLGAIDVEASARALRTASTIEDQVDDLGVEDWSFFVPPDTDTLRVTLAWDDPAGAELADSTLVNDLDLELIGPSGTPTRTSNAWPK